jgi:hypothetical protein
MPISASLKSCPRANRGELCADSHFPGQISKYNLRDLKQNSTFVALRSLEASQCQIVASTRQMYRNEVTASRQDSSA